MLADRAAGNVPAGPAGYPPITEGCILAGTPAAGWPFTQPVLDDGRRMDDALPQGAWLFRQPGPAPAGLPEDVVDLPLDSKGTLSVQNLLDADPPFAQSFYNYDVTNGNPLGRMIKVGIKKQF